ncbi:hypothetical protein GCM10022419_122420 [Nonomuraea rosea]|uniref:Diiron oxygenase n=1 Tax=Nonomuraea rosea TaxID=638574 RepID=A0ABP6ZT40_9ACTN
MGVIKRDGYDEALFEDLVAINDGGVDATESAVIRRLAGNWHRRASVKRDELRLEDLYELDRPDYPESILPFRDHPTWLALDPAQRSDVLTWAIIAFNRKTIVTEEAIANPAFGLVISGEFPALSGDELETCLTQAMVDEQYHTLMHMNASAVTRKLRGRPYPDNALPLPRHSRRHQELWEGSVERWQRSLTTLAFATIAEIGIGPYLDTIADDPDIQPVHSATARLHARDEYCHSAIAAELAKKVYPSLDPAQQRFFTRSAFEALTAYTTADYGTWERIMDLAGVAEGRSMLEDCKSPGRSRLFSDFGGIHSLFSEMGVLEEIDFDWSVVQIHR